MKAIMCMLIFTALTLSSSWLHAQADARMLCTQYAEDSGLAEDEIADYVANCVTNLGGENSAANPLDETESGRERDIGAEMETSESEEDYAEEQQSSDSAYEYDSDDETSESADEYDADEEASESEEYAEDEVTAESMEVYDSDEVTTDQTRDTVSEENAGEYASDPDVDKAKNDLTSPFGEVR